MTPQDPKILAVRRPLEGNDLFRVELGNRVPRGAIYGLNPDVVHAILAYRVREAFAIGSELRTGRYLRIRIEPMCLAEIVEIQQNNFRRAGLPLRVHEFDQIG